MQRDALGGTALIAGALMALTTMALHPTGHDVMRDAEGQGALALAVHALALAGVPITLYGGFALTRRLAEAGPLAELALAFYAVSGVATLMAATASGLLAPGLIARVMSSQADARGAAQVVLHYNGSVNQAFAKLLVGASSVAIGLWSLEILRSRLLRRSTGVVGCVVAAVALVALLSGRLRLDVHGFGAVVLAQATWLVLVGVELRRRAAGAAGAVR